MIRLILLVATMLGVGGWLWNAGPDQVDFGTPSIAAPSDVRVMDGSDPFPH